MEYYREHFIMQHYATLCNVLHHLHNNQIDKLNSSLQSQIVLNYFK